MKELTRLRKEWVSDKEKGESEVTNDKAVKRIITEWFEAEGEKYQGKKTWQKDKCLHRRDGKILFYRCEKKEVVYYVL